MHRGRAGGAGILDAGRALEAQIGRGLQHQRGGEILRREAGVEMTEHDLVDVLGGDTGVGQRLVGNLARSGFRRVSPVKFTEGGVGPADDAGGHRSLLNSKSAELWSLSSGDNGGIPYQRAEGLLPHISSFDSLLSRADGTRHSGPEARELPVATLHSAGLPLPPLSLHADRAQAEAQLLIEASTGKVLHAENATYPWYPASVTKLMTAYTTLRAIEGEPRQVRHAADGVAQRSARSSRPRWASRSAPRVTIDNALKMLMVKSANDIAVTIAEGVGGSIEGFADMMNANARAARHDAEPISSIRTACRPTITSPRRATSAFSRAR